MFQNGELVEGFRLVQQSSSLQLPDFYRKISWDLTQLSGIAHVPLTLSSATPSSLQSPTVMHPHPQSPSRQSPSPESLSPHQHHHCHHDLNQSHFSFLTLDCSTMGCEWTNQIAQKQVAKSLIATGLIKQANVCTSRQLSLSIAEVG